MMLATDPDNRAALRRRLDMPTDTLVAAQSEPDAPDWWFGDEDASASAGGA